VQTKQVSGLKDVQRFFMLLWPQQPSGGSCRLVVIGKKKLPSPAKHERYFAFVGEQQPASQPASQKVVVAAAERTKLAGTPDN
jgi:hypothetical protein